MVFDPVEGYKMFNIHCYNSERN